MEIQDIVFWKEYITPERFYWQTLTEYPLYEGQYVPMADTISGILTFTGTLNMEITYQIPTIFNIEDTISLYHALEGKEMKPKETTHIDFSRGGYFCYDINKNKLYFTLFCCHLEIPNQYKNSIRIWLSHCIEVFKILYPKGHKNFNI